MVTLMGAAKVMPRWRHSSTSYFGRSSVYPTNTSSLVPLKSRIGNTLLNTPCRPMSSRSLSGTLDCRNFS
jgi:hypothetical protein